MLTAFLVLVTVLGSCFLGGFVTARFPQLSRLAVREVPWAAFIIAAGSRAQRRQLMQVLRLRQPASPEALRWQASAPPARLLPSPADQVCACCRKRLGAEAGFPVAGLDVLNAAVARVERAAAGNGARPLVTAREFGDQLRSFHSLVRGAYGSPAGLTEGMWDLAADAARLNEMLKSARGN